MHDTILKLYAGSVVSIEHAPAPDSPTLTLLSEETGAWGLSIPTTPEGFKIGWIEHRTGGEEGDAVTDHGELDLNDRAPLGAGASYRVSLYLFRDDGLRSVPGGKSNTLTMPPAQ